MRTREITRHTRHDRRMCLRCGFDGDRLQGEPGLRCHRCPNCQEDLYTRPPKNYRELEGLPAHAPARRPGTHLTLSPRHPLALLAQLTRLATRLLRRPTRAPAQQPATADIA